MKTALSGWIRTESSHAAAPAGLCAGVCMLVILWTKPQRNNKKIMFCFSDSLLCSLPRYIRSPAGSTTPFFYVCVSRGGGAVFEWFVFKQQLTMATAAYYYAFKSVCGHFPGWCDSTSTGKDWLSWAEGRSDCGDGVGYSSQEYGRACGVISTSTVIVWLFSLPDGGDLHSFLDSKDKNTICKLLHTWNIKSMSSRIFQTWPVCAVYWSCTNLRGSNIAAERRNSMPEEKY